MVVKGIQLCVRKTYNGFFILWKNLMFQHYSIKNNETNLTKLKMNHMELTII